MSKAKPKPLPVLVHVRLDDTPWPDDPTEAEDFYAQLGVAVVAWGRLEGHVVADLLTIRALPGTSMLPNEFPISWKRKAKAWKTAFKQMPQLAPFAPQGIQLMVDIMSHLDKRHWLSHAMWRDFVTAPTFGARSLSVRADDTRDRDEVQLREVVVTLAHLHAATNEANRLNRELSEVSRSIAALRPMPPELRRV